MSPGHSAPLGGERVEFDAGQTGGVEFLQKRLLVFHQFPERGTDHVAGGTVPAVEIQGFHAVISPLLRSFPIPSADFSGE